MDITRFRTQDEMERARESGLTELRREGLEHVTDPAASDWLVKAVTTFSLGARSFVPERFEAVACVYHPISGRSADGSMRSAMWDDVAATAGIEWDGFPSFERLRESAPEGLHSERGTLPRELMGPVLEHLIPATSTPNECYFAVWEGFGGMRVPSHIKPTLSLPGRRYHVFRGTVASVQVTFDTFGGEQSANIWWPADRAWCVGSEIDLHGTHIGASRACIDGLLADSRFEVGELEP